MGSNEVWRRLNGVGVASLIKAILSALAGVGVLALGVVVFLYILGGGIHPPVLRVPLVVFVVAFFGSIGTALVWSAVKIFGTTRRRRRNEAWVRKVFAGRCPWCLENVARGAGEEGVFCAGCGAPSIERASIHAECLTDRSHELFVGSLGVAGCALASMLGLWAFSGRNPIPVVVLYGVLVVVVGIGAIVALVGAVIRLVEYARNPWVRWRVFVVAESGEGAWEAEWTLEVDKARLVARAGSGRSTSRKFATVAELLEWSSLCTREEWAPEVVLRARKLAAALLRGDTRAARVVDRELKFARVPNVASQRSVPFRDFVGEPWEVLSRTEDVFIDVQDQSGDWWLLYDCLVDGVGMNCILDAIEISAGEGNEALVEALLTLCPFDAFDESQLKSNDGVESSSGGRS